VEFENIVKDIDEGKLALTEAIKNLNNSKKNSYVVNSKRFNF
jgi:exonuclease VII small subunit